DLQPFVHRSVLQLFHPLKSGQPEQQKSDKTFSIHLFTLVPDFMTRRKAILIRIFGL